MRRRISTILNKLKADSFPMLKEKKIHIFVMQFRFYACSVWIPPFMRFIIISKRAKDFSDSVLTGIMAHELCHQERYLEMGILRYLKFAVGFITSRKIQSGEEKATDMLTIEKGYGRQLYELSQIQYFDKKHEKINEYYLSLEEIKSYSERIGKW
jgi:hypothetical protein